MYRYLLLICLGTAATCTAKPLQDPTKPVSSTQGRGLKESANAKQDMNFTGVFIKDGKRLAIIADQILAPGQKWQDFEVLEVTHNSVILKVKQQKKEFLLNQQLDIKKDVANDF